MGTQREKVKINLVTSEFEFKLTLSLAMQLLSPTFGQGLGTKESSLNTIHLNLCSKHCLFHSALMSKTLAGNSCNSKCSYSQHWGQTEDIPQN